MVTKLSHVPGKRVEDQKTSNKNLQMPIQLSSMISLCIHVHINMLCSMGLHDIHVDRKL